jgi:flagellar assembly factor FliW
MKGDWYGAPSVEIKTDGALFTFLRNKRFSLVRIIQTTKRLSQIKKGSLSFYLLFNPYLFLEGDFYKGQEQSHATLFLMLCASANNPVSISTLLVPLRLKRLKALLYLIFPKTGSTSTGLLLL